MSGKQASAAGRRPGRARQVGQAMPSVVSVVSLVVLAAAMVVFFVGGGGDEDPAAEPQARTGAAGAAAPGPSPTATPTATPSPDGADRDRPAGPGREPSAGQQQGPGARRQSGDDRPAPQPRHGPPDVYVEVYNNTPITGLAASTAAELQDAGWQVVGVDNWYGDIPASTVYYPDGLRDEARRLRQALGIGRIHVAVAPMKFDRLTVILTPDAA